MTLMLCVAAGAFDVFGGFPSSKAGGSMEDIYCNIY